VQNDQIVFVGERAHRTETQTVGGRIEQAADARAAVESIERRGMQK